MASKLRVDATTLSGLSFSVLGATAALPSNAVQDLVLGPGSYRLQVNGGVPSDWVFIVTPQGLVDYIASLDVEQGGFLSGRGSSTLVVAGLLITLDGRQLSADMCALADVTGWLPTASLHRVRLLPGHYSFVQPNGLVPAAAFEVRADGTIDYPTTSDAFLSGRGMSTLRIAGLPITVDATASAMASYAIYLITGWLNNNASHSFNLLPGRYDFQQGNGLVPSAAFDVQPDGTIDYAPTSDAFLSGRGTSTFRVIGLPVSVDATQAAMASYAIYLITSWLSNDAQHLLNLLPGRYEFQQGNGLVPAAAFDVRADGTIDYAVTGDAFLSGRGTSTLVVVGFSITVDATSTAMASYAIYLITSWLGNDAPRPLNLLPGRYEFQQGNGLVPAAAFEVQADGTIGYAAASDVFLSGRGTSTFRVIGLPVSVDATQAAMASYAIYLITSWLSNDAQHLLNLLPGRYEFQQGNGLVPAAAFDVRADGTIDYAVTSDAFLSGRGTSTLVVVGFSITVDATSTAMASYAIYLITSWLGNDAPRPLNLLPGRYEFQQGNGLVPAAAFEVQADGTIGYAAASDAFLSGRGTSTFRVVGLPITVDATPTAMASYTVYLITGWLRNDMPHTLNLLPGNYDFLQGNGLAPAAAFEVRTDGTIDYAPTSDAFLNGRGTSAFRIAGLPITIDATQAVVPAYAVYLITGWLKNDVPHTLNLLPGHYEFLRSAGLLPEAAFDVLSNGVVDYPDASDANAPVPGVLGGRGSSRLQIRGYRVDVDAGAYAGSHVTLMPAGIEIDTAASAPRTLGLLPEADYSLHIQATELLTANFMLTRGGRIVLDEPYPFVELQWQSGHPLIRLTTQALRLKDQCCVAGLA